MSWIFQLGSVRLKAKANKQDDWRVFLFPTEASLDTKNRAHSKSIWRDIFIFSSVILDVSLVASLFFSYYSLKIFYLIGAPLGFFVASSLIFIGHKIRTRRYGSKEKEFEFKGLFGHLRNGQQSGAERKKRRTEIELESGGFPRFIAPLGEMKAVTEVGMTKTSVNKKAINHAQSLMHTCPKHGLESCAGSYLSMHTCNQETGQSKQLTWEEVPRVYGRHKEWPWKS